MSNKDQWQQYRKMEKTINRQKEDKELSLTCQNIPYVREGEIKSSGLPWIQEDWWYAHFTKGNFLEKGELTLTAAKRTVNLLVKEIQFMHQQ